MKIIERQVIALLSLVPALLLSSATLSQVALDREYIQEEDSYEIRVYAEANYRQLVGSQPPPEATPIPLPDPDARSGSQPPPEATPIPLPDPDARSGAQPSPEATPIPLPDPDARSGSQPPPEANPIPMP